ncbi:sodium/hydrogen exchanger 6-like protein [Corchorus olitorius]|uniref:Sodium/hydrogen exchanger 6-like protein n=1 Tax=Corchorus olitorius TaxID=93759 RepID=A0A1R3G783_9ROSI|nr:sodium/hydrogen exchanger 6-like protein [Corchorus olitorius]
MSLFIGLSKLLIEVTHFLIQRLILGIRQECLAVLSVVSFALSPVPFFENFHAIVLSSFVLYAWTVTKAGLEVYIADLASSKNQEFMLAPIKACHLGNNFRLLVSLWVMPMSCV